MPGPGIAPVFFIKFYYYVLHNFWPFLAGLKLGEVCLGGHCWRKTLGIQPNSEDTAKYFWQAPEVPQVEGFDLNVDKFA